MADLLGLEAIKALVDLARAVDPFPRVDAGFDAEHLADLDVVDAVSLGKDVGRGRLAGARRARDQDRDPGPGLVAHRPDVRSARSAASSSGGSGASARISFSPDGDANSMRHECRKGRVSPSGPRLATPVAYTGSPAMGWPIDARWTRIW